MEDRKMRAACYVRTSTDREEQEGSFQLQKEYFINMIKEDPDLEFVDCYGDFGKSGRSMEHRPEFQRMLRDCEAGKIDVIYTKSVSRFARSIADLVEVVQKLRELGVFVYFESQELNTAERQTELLLHILGIVAQEESRSFGENVRLGLEMRMATGHPVGQTAYGYRRVDKDANWAIVEEQAERVRLAFRKAAEGACYQEIKKALDDLESEKGTGVHWGPDRIRRLLRNECYKGDVLTGKTYTIYGERKQQKRNYGERPQYYLEQHHAPIVTPELFDRVQLIMDLGLLHSMKYVSKPEERRLLADDSWRSAQDRLEMKVTVAGVRVLEGGYQNGNDGSKINA